MPVLLVVHTHVERGGEEVIRIIQRARQSPVKGKSMRKLTKVQKEDIKKLRAKRDADIDFSDAPLVLDWSKAEIGKFYRPAKKPVTIRLDSDVIDWLKSDGPGYQTKANWLLRSAMLHFGRKAARGSKRTGKRSR